MTQIRAQVITRRLTDLPRDSIVNTVHFRVDPIWDPVVDGPNWTNIATDLRNVFKASRQFIPDGYGVEVKVYDVQQAQPREVKAHAPWQLYNQPVSGDAAPREVALCLSFRGASNVPRQRGRIFIGPWAVGVMKERPEAGPRANLIALANGMANIGGVDIDWCVRSTFPVVAGNLGGTMYPVQASFVDDEWDTVRSRGLKSTARTSATHSE